MRRFCLFIAATLFTAFPACAADVLILQSKQSKAMDQVTRYVQNECAFENNRSLVMSDYTEFDLARLVREERPAVLVAIGDQALAAAKRLRRVPVVYAMALNSTEEGGRDNIAGVTMMVAPKYYLKLFASLKLHRIGILHDRGFAAPYLRRAAAAADGSGIELIPLQVRSPEEERQSLSELHKRNIDALWLMPHAAAITPETVDSYFEFARKNRLPIVGFSAAFLSRGALAAVEVTPRDIGSQVCQKIRQSRSGTPGGISDISVGRVTFNNAMADKLGIKPLPSP